MYTNGTTQEDGMRTSTWKQIFRRKDIGGHAGAGDAPALTIRAAVPEDAGALARLAALDSSRAPRGLVLLAEVRGEPWAALSLDDQHTVADPFRPSGELVPLLLERARDLRRGEPAGIRRHPRVWPRTELDSLHETAAVR
jgi:hypothetical protein